MKRTTSSLSGVRRSARADESDGLENRCGRKATVGSNPTSSASQTTSFAGGACSAGSVSAIAARLGWLG
jgi:hypothetical protein